MIRVSGVEKRFGRTSVLSKVDLTVERGKTSVILGRSGSGKSVFMKILASLIYPDSGSVKLESPNVGMLFQKNALFDSLTVVQNLEFPLEERTKLSRAEREEKALKYLEWVGLAGTGRLFPDELSGGMQKRLGIARALIVEPEIILYDEPTAGLDPVTSKMIADLILRLKKEKGSTVVVVTSDVARAWQLGDAVSLLIPAENGGATLLHAGSPHEARNSSHPMIRQFVKGEIHGPLSGEP